MDVAVPVRSGLHSLRSAPPCSSNSSCSALGSCLPADFCRTSSLSTPTSCRPGGGPRRPPSARSAHQLRSLATVALLKGDPGCGNATVERRSASRTVRSTTASRSTTCSRLTPTMPRGRSTPPAQLFGQRRASRCECRSRRPWTPCAAAGWRPRVGDPSSWGGEVRS